MRIIAGIGCLLCLVLIFLLIKSQTEYQRLAQTHPRRKAWWGALIATLSTFIQNKKNS